MATSKDNGTPVKDNSTPVKNNGTPVLENALGLDVILKAGAVFSFYFLIQGFSYALGLNGVKLSGFVMQVINSSGVGQGIKEPDLYLSITAGALHLSNISLPGHKCCSWPLLPVAVALLLLYACFLAERLRESGADAVNLAFFSALFVVFVMMYGVVTPWWGVNVVLLIVIPIGIYVLARFKHVPLPKALHTPVMRHMMAVVTIGILLMVGFKSSYDDGYCEAEPAECKRPVGCKQFDKCHDFVKP